MSKAAAPPRIRPMDLDGLPTPTLVLDEGRLRRNVAAMTGRAKALGVGLRPTMKTAKSAEVAKRALDGNFGGIAVSTLLEAEYFLDHGIGDITYAVCVVPRKLDPAAALIERGADLKLITDDAGVARAIAADGRPFKVLIEIDCGEHRTGVAPDGLELLAIADALKASAGAQLAGVLTHAGHSYLCRSGDEMARIAEDERAAVAAAAERLRDAGHPCAIVSVGSTPTARFAKDLTGVTEMRPGVYMLGDLFQAGIGTCAIDDIAASVLASVIAHRPDENVLLIDAGGLALSKDRSTAALDEDCDYGLVCDARTGTPIAGLRVAAVHQEHGHVTGAAPLAFDHLPVGAKVRVLPNHVCMTAAAYDAYSVIDDAGRVIATWGRCNGW
ncbi:MAG: alanine racemase [Rhodospirillales bacterium]